MFEAISKVMMLINGINNIIINFTTENLINRNTIPDIARSQHYIAV